MVRTLFTVTVFLGSALLFLVQPMIAKMILPYFGGAPAVWNSSMVFFQVTLLAGYAYAHFGSKWLGVKLHGLVHMVALVLAALTLPFAISASFDPQSYGVAPGLVVASLLATTVGAAFFIVSAGAPLVQRWFAHTSDSAAADPYFLYAASNVGSFVALLGYPFALESRLNLTGQAGIWKSAFLVLALGLAACFAITWKGYVERPPETHTASPTWRARLRWIALAAVPSSLLLGVTNYLTSNIASIPLLWVIPLALYLLSYVVAFSAKRWLSAERAGRITALLLAPLSLTLVLEATEPFWLLGVFHLVVFFFAALMCHTELAETRPAPDHLTEFFMWTSLGGAIGGAFNAFVAPMVFKSVAEYPIALVAAAALRQGKPDVRVKPKLWVAPFIVAGLTFAMWLVVGRLHLGNSRLNTLFTMGLPAIISFLCIDTALVYAACLGAFLLMAQALAIAQGGRALLTERSFFGIHRIVEPGGTKFRTLIHGNTIHGRQSLDPQYRDKPLTYYFPTGPIGVTIESLQKRQSSLHFGFVGLGIGSLAAYGRPSDDITYFEIDPIVVKIAKDPQYFTFLSSCKAKLNIELGDARLRMRSQPDGKFDLLVIDAFSSDSIPMHLITEEAMRLFASKLKPNGTLAFHISNRYLNLRPVLAAEARDLAYAGIVMDDLDLDEEDERIGKTPSVWVLLSAQPDALKPISAEGGWTDLALQPAARPWTDDRSNLLEAWKGF